MFWRKKARKDTVVYMPDGEAIPIRCAEHKSTNQHSRKRKFGEVIVHMPDGEKISFTMRSLSKAEKIYVTALVVGQIAITVLAILLFVVDKVAW